MRKNNAYVTFLAAFSMMLLILDSKTAFSGAQNGIDLCVRSLIPSLFPFIAVSNILTEAFGDLSNPIIRKLFHVPAGTEGIIISSFLGGYPVGAQSVGQSYQTNQLSYNCANYMLQFCNQAGPAFIFGILTSQFPSKHYVWALWIIQIISAICVSYSFSGNYEWNAAVPEKKTHVNIPTSVKRSIYTMSVICGWVIIFRVIISFLDKWILYYLSSPVKFLIFGLLELSNGCVYLSEMPNLLLRFLTATLFLSFGGLCITMQTASVIHGLSVKLYLKGKVLQLFYSIIFSFIYLSIMDGSAKIVLGAVTALSLLLLSPGAIRKKQKKGSITQQFRV